MINLKTDLAPDAGAGGQWRFISMVRGTFQFPDPISLVVDGTEADYTFNNVVGTNDSPDVEFSKNFTGKYRFRYTLPATDTCPQSIQDYFVDTTQMITRDYGTVEDHQWMSSALNAGSHIKFSLDYLTTSTGSNIVTTQDLTITPANKTTSIINGIEVITNVADWLNQIIDDTDLCFTFAPYAEQIPYTINGNSFTCQTRLLRITYPSWYTDWEMSFNADVEGGFVNGTVIDAADAMIKKPDGVFSYAFTNSVPPPHYDLNPTGCNPSDSEYFKQNRMSGFRNETINCGAVC